MSVVSSLARRTINCSAKLALGLLWLLSATLAFGQDSLPTSPTGQELLDDVTPLNAPPSRDQFSTHLSPATLRLLSSSLLQAPVQAENSRLPIAANNALPQFGQQQAATLTPAIEPVRAGTTERFHWAAATGQSIFFLGIEHGIRLAFDPPSRAALKGEFISDYLDSLHQLGHWGDGNPMFINYLGHPLQGSITGFIQIQNDPGGRAVPFSWTREYRNSRLKALVWTAAYSTYFEIGFPLSEAALGNLGVDTNRQTQQGLVDIVITPTLGLCWLMTEDFVDRYVVGHFEHGQSSHSLRLLRTFLNPTRSVSNMLRFKVPWYRDGRPWE